MRAHWADRRRADSAPDALVWAVLGDSAAVGLGAPTPADAYVERAAARLEARLGRDVRVINLARSGATAPEVLERQIPQLRALAGVDLVSCVVGGNDVAWPRRFDADGFAAAVQGIAEAIPAGSVLGLVPSFGHWPYDGRARRANAEIRAAAGRRGHEVAELGDAMGSAWGERLRLLAGDGFHPNARGHDRWAHALAAALVAAAAPGARGSRAA